MSGSYRGDRVALDVLTLDSGDTATVRPPDGEEGAVVLLCGSVDVEGERATRADVFGERATAVYVPPGAATTVVAHARTELAFVSTIGANLDTDARRSVVVVRPADVVVHHRGRPGWERDVHDVVAASVPAHHLLVGETFNEPGQWSSFPPHKHDGRDGEPALEEVYYYRFDRPDGFGFQGLYDGDGNERAEFLRHGRIVGIASGYHPVCAAPGYRLYYLWALVGDERVLSVHEDPAQRWLGAT